MAQLSKPDQESLHSLHFSSRTKSFNLKILHHFSIIFRDSCCIESTSSSTTTVWIIWKGKKANRDCLNFHHPWQIRIKSSRINIKWNWTHISPSSSYFYFCFEEKSAENIKIAAAFPGLSKNRLSPFVQ